MTDTEFTTEEWRPVVGFEGRYEVSNLGRVKSLQNRGKGPPMILLPMVGRKGYLGVVLGCRDRRRAVSVHVLVAEAFLGPRPVSTDGYRIEVNHVDGIKANCRSSNLEWMTQLENMQHAARTGLMPTGIRHSSRTHPEKCPAGERNGRAKLTESSVATIRARLATGRTKTSLAREFSVSDVAVHMIAIGKTWRRHASTPPNSPDET